MNIDLSEDSLSVLVLTLCVLFCARLRNSVPTKRDFFPDVTSGMKTTGLARHVQMPVLQYTAGLGQLATGLIVRARE